jgi:hypothetical protein
MAKPNYAHRTLAGNQSSQARANEDKVIVTTSGQVFRSTRDVLFAPINSVPREKTPAKK